MIPKSWWRNGLTGLVMIAALAVAGPLIRGDREGRCVWDGLHIEPIYRVTVVETVDSAHEFCCLRCAESWLERRGRPPIRILVTDEASGRQLDAFQAHYVRSTVATNAVTGNRCHVFRDQDDALRHASAANGRQLSGDERPFASIQLNVSESH